MLKFCAALLIAATCVLTQPLPPAPVATVWEGMYPPPYLQSPEISLAMDCVASNACFIAGASNGAGGGVYQYDGKMEGQITKMTDDNMSMIVMDLAMGGTATAPKGVFSGVVDFTIGAGLQYLDGKDWKASAMPFEIVWASQSVAGDNNGLNYVAVGNGFTNDLMISNDGGATFRNQNINYKPANDNCSAPANIAIASDNLWFMTWGAEPAQHHKGSSSSGKSNSNSNSGSGSSSFRASHSSDVNSKYYDIKTEQIVQSKANGRVLIIKNVETGKIRTVAKTAFEHREDQLQAAAGDQKCNYYYGEILKSTDKGQTWTMVYQNKNAMVSFIQCFDAENCAATIFNADESYVAVTTNGNTWQITLKTPVPSSTLAISIGNLGYASKSEIWVGGSEESQSSGKGMFWSSKDAGMTWTQYPHYIPDVMVITSVSFAPDGTGFASGLTMFKTTQIMRYKKQADYGDFIQSHCPIAGCVILCQNVSFPQGMCLTAQGGSAKAFCTPNGVEQFMYTTTSCVGSYTKQVQPINQCLNGTNSFFENYCPGQGFSAQGARKAGKNHALRHL